jgi:diguanylate cyclase (GGDEF)-like protein
MKGDLTTRVNDDNPDEIGHLARTIDTLARDLEADQLKRLEVEARLRHQALHDELTGLLNRKHANSIIAELNADRTISHSVMFLDLNGFKDVNDLYGHAAGDQVLVTIADRLAVEVGPAATLARWGGDEFVIILPECGKSEATEFAARVHNAFDDPVVTSKGVHHLSCSVGLATSSRTKSLDDALMEADIQMYEQKKRQQQRHSKGSLAARTVERALLEDRIEVWYQPVVRYRRPGNYELAGAEAMVRVCSSEGGVILPEEFLRDVNASELGTDLDRQVLTHALSSLARWNAAAIVRPDFRLSVNLTAQSLTDPTFSAILSHQLEASGIRGEQIVLVCPRDTRVDAELLRQLCALDVGLSLGRIGTEPTGLPEPSAHRPDLVRISGQWLSDRVLAPHIMAICTQLNLEVIIEAIETREQMAALHDTGAVLFQGNLFDRPLRAVDFVSRWGESSLQGMGEKFSRTLALRLAV